MLGDRWEFWYERGSMSVLKKTLLSLGLAITAICFVMPASAIADSNDKAVIAKTKKAMEEYDMMEFESAKTILLEAIAAGEGGDKGVALATAYLNLGIVYYSGLDAQDDASEAFAKAVAIEPSIELGVAYSTPEMKTLLESVREETAANAGADCDVTGVSHTLIDEAVFGTAPEVLVKIGADVNASGVLLFFRSEGELEFTKVNLSKQGTCEYVGHIPTRAVQGKFVHYYVAAVDQAGKDIGHKGSSGSPNIIEVATTGGSVTMGDEDPLSGGDDVSKNAGLIENDSGPSVFVSIGVGSGGGYVQGPTEKTRSDVNCCVGSAYLSLLPEIGYYLSSQLAISAAVRIGFPIGANVDGHATLAPAGLLRVRYSLATSGEGFQVTGALGAGIIRNVVPIDMAPEGMDADTTAMGPLLLGSGFGYNMKLSGIFHLVAEVNALAALTAGMDEIGDCPGVGCVEPKNGLQIDANLALMLAF